MKTEMQCDDASSYLPLFVGGDLEAPLAESLSGHLVRCEPCSQRLEGLERARGALISIRRAGPADGSRVDLWAGIRSQLASEGLLDSGAHPVLPSVSSRATSGRFRHGIQRRLGGLAAAAAFVLLVWSPWRDAPQVVGPDSAPTAPGVASLEPGVAPQNTSAVTPLVEPEVQLISNGLRRVLPGEERLADSARPFPTLLPIGAGSTGNGEVLVGGKRLR